LRLIASNGPPDQTLMRLGWEPLSTALLDLHAFCVCFIRWD